MKDFKGLLWLAVTAGLIYLLSPILTPFMIAALLAYLGDPLVDCLQRWHIPRTIGVLCVFFITFALLLGLLVLVIPLIERQAVILFSHVPAMIEWMQTHLIAFLKPYLDIHSLDSQTVQKAVTAGLPKLGEMTQSLLRAISYSGYAMVGFVIDFFLVVVVAFYLMRDWKKVLLGVKHLLPHQRADKIIKIAKGSDEILGSFFKGQLLVMLSLAGIYSVGLTLAGLNVGFVIGVIAGIISVVPYLGSMVGLLLAVIAALFQFHTVLPLLWVLLVFLIGQVAEGMILTPWLVGDRIGLHPVAVIFSVLAGGLLFGFLGVLLALPVAAVIRVVFQNVSWEAR